MKRRRDDTLAEVSIDAPVTADVAAAAERIAPWIRHTPVVRVQGPGARPIVLKLEGLQRSGSFKLRGALNKVMSLGADAKAGVVTASGGNHGLGVAWAGWLLGVPVQVCVPSAIPKVKIEALEACAAEVSVVPGRYPDAERAARGLAVSRDLPYVHAYDDRDVIAGAGTCVRELVAAAPEVRTIVVSIGGGGLASGSSLATEGRRLVGVEPFGAPTMHAALRDGGPVTLQQIESVAADALGAGRVSELTFAMCRAGLDRVELVDDAAIRGAQRWLWTHLRVVAEPGAAAGLAALTAGLLDDDPGPIGLLVCGANADLNALL